MQRGWQAGHLLSVPFYIHAGAWLFIALIGWLLAAMILPFLLPFLNEGARWLLALMSSLLFAATVVAHELAHVWMARRRGMVATGIALFYFGAVAWFDDEPQKASDEAMVALAGPAASGLLALLAAATWWVLRGNAAHPALAAATVALFLAQMNGVLAIFNMLPAYPLDGGRLVHALSWRFTGDFERAIGLTARIGQILALVIAVGGLWLSLSARHPVLLFGTLALGWFLYGNAGSTLHHLSTRRQMAAFTVGQLMWTTGPILHPAQSLEEASHLMMGGEVVLPVADGGKWVGLMTHADLRGVAHAERGSVRVATHMRPATSVPSLAPVEPAVTALHRMERAQLVALPVVEHGALVGMLRHRDLVEAARRPAVPVRVARS